MGAVGSLGFQRTDTEMPHSDSSREAILHLSVPRTCSLERKEMKFNMEAVRDKLRVYTKAKLLVRTYLKLEKPVWQRILRENPG